MATYSSRPVVVAQPAEELAQKFADFTVLQQRMDTMPAEQKAAIGEVTFSADTISIHTPQMGEIRLKAIGRSIKGMVLEAQGSPVPMKLNVALNPVDAASTEVKGSIEVEIPALLRPMIGPTLQKAADRFGELFASLA